MELLEILNEIELLAKKNKLSIPYICGGVPRDKILNKTSDFTDLDLTTGDGSVHQLAKLVYQRFLPIGAKYLVFPDSHSQVNLPGLKLDFSSNFIIPKLNQILSTKNISNLSSLKLEMYSRDFTCNALLMDLKITKILDPLNSGIKDLAKKFLTTCLDVNLTLGIDPKRIPRVFYLASKLDLEVDPDIIFWIKKNPLALKICKLPYLTKKMLQAFKYNAAKTTELLNQTNLWPYLPSTPALIPYFDYNNINNLP